MGKRKREKHKYVKEKEEGLVLQGEVVNMPGGGFYKVLTELGTEVQAKLSGKMKKGKIRVVVGDTVTVEVTPYDTQMGRITYRER